MRKKKTKFFYRWQKLKRNHYKLSKNLKYYLAGFIDGEGSIGITKAKRIGSEEFRYHPFVVYGVTSKDFMEWILSLFPYGRLREQKHRKKPNWNSGWIIQIRNFLWIKLFLKEIGPYLVLKKNQADILKGYLDRWFERKQYSQRKTKNYPSPVDFKDAEETYQKLRLLNQKGKEI